MNRRVSLGHQKPGFFVRLLPSLRFCCTNPVSQNARSCLLRPSETGFLSETAPMIEVLLYKPGFSECAIVFSSPAHPSHQTFHQRDRVLIVPPKIMEKKNLKNR